MILNPEVKLYYYLTQEFIFQPLTLRLLYLIKKREPTMPRLK